MLYYDEIKEEQATFNLDALMRRMIVDPKYPGHKIAWVITTIWDEIWSEEQYYIGEGGNSGDYIGRRYQEALEFFSMDAVERHRKYGPIIMPRIKIVDVRGRIIFGNGRHRYCVMRDLGAERIPLSMDEPSLQNAERFGYI